MQADNYGNKQRTTKRIKTNLRGGLLSEANPSGSNRDWHNLTWIF